MPKIMIVDDDQSIQKIMCKVLNRKGYETSSASDGPTALEKISLGTPDLILLDKGQPADS